ncbi:lysylphosphatidylglycerol synthase transmembrane domain-containing protein [Ornithinimicrobium sp. CNJ-824]|uniref:lysylphosphatidylglycerol synthase transmembrane domain-containing protein n=1 Tax=Ornithinimicrobium sp. CNJ-824 TaxID=1904966 RepID=UPI00117E640D|nr:lysylphosphatidylglycerol synthase transmembrane domain-containing protein [Ornithinimicrobium sp. CNJ-824]
MSGPGELRTGGPAEHGRGRARVLRALDLLRSPWARRGFLLAAVAAAVLALVVEREAAGRALDQVSWSFVVLALGLSVLNVLFAALSWRAVAGGLGVPLGVRDAAVVYLVGQVGKYLPGSVWNLLASAELGRDRGVGRRLTVGTLLVGVLLSAVVGAALVLVTLPGVGGTPLEPHGWLVLLAPVVLLLVLPPVLGRVLELALRVTGQAPARRRPDAGSVAAGSAWSLASWVAIGLQVLVLAVAVGAQPGVPLLRTSLGGYALAWLVGTALVFLPAGVGAREAVLALVLAPVLDAGAVLVVVLLSRVLLTLADLLAAGGAMLVQRWWPAQPTPRSRRR